MKLSIPLKFAICSLVLVLLISCNGFQHAKPSSEFPPPTSTLNLGTETVMKGQNWVIFPAVQAEKIQEEIASWLFESDGYWTPSADDILKIEENIAEYLIQNANNFHWQPPVWERLDEYLRQYVGLERGGIRIIYGNFFCDSGKQNWGQDIVFAIDGGECYFQVEYDVEREHFIKLRVNGES